MSSLPVRRRSERFAAILDGSATSADGGLAPLAELASALRVVGATCDAAVVDPDFRSALRQRLVAVATVTEPEPAPARRSTVAGLTGGMRRRVAVVASGVTMATAVAGVGVAATRSLPGDPFYSVKRATEDVQLWTSHGNLAKGQRHLEFARTRLAEARELGNASTSTYASTLAAMDSQTRQGTAELLTAARDSHSVAPLNDLDRFAREQYAELTQLAGHVTPAVRGLEQRSVGVLVTVVQQVRSARAATSLPAPAPGAPIQPAPSKSPSPKAQPSSHPSSGVPTTRATQPGHVTPTKQPSLPTRVPTKPPTHLPTQLPTRLPTKLPMPTVTSLLPLGH